MSAIKYIFLFLLTIGVLAFFLLRENLPDSVKKIFEPVSVVSQVVADGELQSTDGRTNILLLGIDSRSAGSDRGTVLTDTIMVVSIDEDGTRPVIISIPRDLWIEELQTKINSVYAFTGRDIEVTKKAVSSVVGIPIHYYAIVGFDTFVDSITAVDGIEITVDKAFDDYDYPIEGMENASNIVDRYQHIRFNAGRQIMDGETALKYARSRHSTNPNEAGDFARARRQQKVILALKEKILSAETLFNPLKIKNLYDSYKSNVITNIKLPEALLFYDKYKDVELGEIARVVISNEPTSDQLGSGTVMSLSKEQWEARYGPDKPYQYVLTPISRTFDQIRAIVREALFKD